MKFGGRWSNHIQTTVQRDWSKLLSLQPCFPSSSELYVFESPYPVIYQFIPVNIKLTMSLGSTNIISHCVQAIEHTGLIYRFQLLLHCFVEYVLHESGQITHKWFIET